MGAAIVSFAATKLAGFGFFGAAGAVFAHAGVIAAGINFAGLYGAARILSKKADFDDSDFLGGSVVAGGSGPAFIAYGQCALGGSLADIRVDNRTTSHGGVYDLHHLIAHALRPGGIDSIAAYWLDDERIPNTPAHIDSEGIKTGKFGKRTGVTRAFYIKSGDGTQTVANGRGPHLLAATFDQWSATGTAAIGAPLIGAGTEVVYSHIRMRLTDASKEVYSNGPPNFRMEARWNKVYDPRLDSTRGGAGSHRFADPSTWEWSDNPALCCADYLTQYVPGVGEDDIDWRQVAAWADNCDEQVAIPGGGTEKRYTLNIGLSTANTHRHNLDVIFSSCNASETIVDGRHSFIPHEYKTPTQSFGEDNIIGGISHESNRWIDEETNAVYGQYNDASDGFAEKDFPSRRNQAAIDANRELPLELTYPAVTGHRQAQRLADGVLNLQRNSERIVVPLNWEALWTRVGANIQIDYPLFGYSAKTFRVRRMEIDLLGSKAPVIIYAEEDQPGIYTDLPASDYHTYEGKRIVRAAQSPYPPTAFTVDAGTVPGELIWSWTPPDTDFDHIELWTSPTADWADAELEWSGDATSHTQKGLTGTSSQRTRWGWVRAIRGGVVSIRRPDDDVSNTTATAIVQKDNETAWLLTPDRNILPNPLVPTNPLDRTIDGLPPPLPLNTFFQDYAPLDRLTASQRAAWFTVRVWDAAAERWGDYSEFRFGARLPEEGTPVLFGQDDPDDADGVDGQFYVQYSGTIWQKIGGTWEDTGANLAGQSGNLIYTGAVAAGASPSITGSKAGDLFFSNTIGDGRWWRWAGASWVFQGSTTGSPGTDAQDGTPGISSRETTIFRLVARGAGNPPTPGGGVWNHSLGRLSSTPSGWSRLFPNYDPDTHKVACSTASGFSDDTLSAWSPVYICDAPGDLNSVFRRYPSGTTPGRPSSGTSTIPSGWVDTGSLLAGSGLAWMSVGHRGTLSDAWEWAVPVRVEALDGRDGTDGVDAYSVTPPALVAWHRTASTASFDPAGTQTSRVEWLLDGTVAAWFERDFRANADGTISQTASRAFPGTGSFDNARTISDEVGERIVAERHIASGVDGFHVAFALTDGVDGRGVVGVVRRGDEITFTYSDGTEDMFAVRDGLPGQDITIVASTTVAGGVRLTFSDGTVITIPTGPRGIAGRGISDIVYDPDSRRWTISFDDGSPDRIFSVLGTQVWYSGDDRPNDGLGEDGDFFLRTDDQVVYQKVSGSWIVLVDLANADSATWHSGTGDPSDSLGNDGDFYFKTSDATIWSRSGGTWTQQIDIDGMDGSTWHSGTVFPSGGLGEVGDFYFRSSNGFIYEKTGIAVWTFRRDITGPAGRGISSVDRAGDTVTITYTSGADDTFTLRDGLPGEDITITGSDVVTGGVRLTFSDGTAITIPIGPRGVSGRGIMDVEFDPATNTWTISFDDGSPDRTFSTIGAQNWYSGSGVPNDGLGEDGDFFLRTDTRRVYRKVSGSWDVLVDLSSADAATWHDGSGVPSNSLGNNGDFYFRTTNATIWTKSGGTWSQQIDIDGQDGATWHSGTGVPAGGLGETGDFYFRTTNGFVYEKTASTTWTFRRDITGPEGGPGEDGLDGYTVSPPGVVAWHRSDTSSSFSPSGTQTSRVEWALDGTVVAWFERDFRPNSSGTISQTATRAFPGSGAFDNGRVLSSEVGERVVAERFIASGIDGYHVGFAITDGDPGGDGTDAITVETPSVAVFRRGRNGNFNTSEILTTRLEWLIGSTMIGYSNRTWRVDANGRISGVTATGNVGGSIADTGADNRKRTLTYSYQGVVAHHIILSIQDGNDGEDGTDAVGPVFASPGILFEFVYAGTSPSNYPSSESGVVVWRRINPGGGISSRSATITMSKSSPNANIVIGVQQGSGTLGPVSVGSYGAQGSLHARRSATCENVEVTLVAT